MNSVRKYWLILVSISSIVVQLDAVTINPSLCPTNKIAPHRRLASWDQTGPRTLGLIYDLLGPRRPPTANDLQEQPQEDDPDDCGEIEDYDETDLSSITPGAQRRKDRVGHFHHHLHRPPYYPVDSRPPYTGYRPQRPTQVPSGFNEHTTTQMIHGSVYRPPSHHYSPDHIKPVKEDIQDSPQEAYKPNLIGGSYGHIVGFAPVRPTTAASKITQNPFRFPESSPYTNTRLKKSMQTNKSTSIIGSFVDLLFN